MWDSESGNVADLGNIKIKEWVLTLDAPNPPFTFQPHFVDGEEIAGTQGYGNDYHWYDPPWVNYANRTTGTMTAKQMVVFHDTVYMAPDPWTAFASYDIVPQVIDNPGATYKFKMTKTGTGIVTPITRTETP